MHILLFFYNHNELPRGYISSNTVEIPSVHASQLAGTIETKPVSAFPELSMYQLWRQDDTYRFTRSKFKVTIDK